MYYSIKIHFGSHIHIIQLIVNERLYQIIVNCFRMKRNTFQYILDLVRPQLCKQSERFGREPIAPEKQLLIAIWTLATPNSYR